MRTFTRITDGKIIIMNLSKPKRERTKEQRNINGSANDDLPISHMLFPGSGSHQASLITRPARSSLLYTDFESTASFRHSAGQNSPRQIPSTDLGLPVIIYPLLHWCILCSRDCNDMRAAPISARPVSILADRRAPVWIKEGVLWLIETLESK
jgi:hypothetical protein